jgi:tetratricopeptide (TPR) repeat protein
MSGADRHPCKATASASGPALLLTLLAASVLAACAGSKTRPHPQTIGDLSAEPPSLPVHIGAMPAAAPSAAMDNYRQFLQLQNSDPKLRAEAMRRLGDLNLESGELDRMSRELTQVDTQSADAIELYSTLLKAYPNYPRNDQVLYQLARAYDTTGQSDKALATFDQIVARYPASRDIGEVQFRRGELLFSAQHYADAQRAYEAVIARGPAGSGFYAQSLYKHAWSQFKQGMNEDSLQGFADLLDFTLTDPQRQHVRSLQSLGRADHELVDDTLRVMSISFSYLDGSQSIDELIAHRQRMPYAWLLYQRLGDLYVQKQRFQDAATTYRAFVARDPVDAHAPELSMAAIEAYRRGGFPALMLQGKLEYVQRYDFPMPFWQGRAHGDYPQVVDELKTNLRDVAEYYHATAQKSKSNDDYVAAAHWYRAYLTSFPGEPDSAATNYRLADALFESKQYLAAAGEYERTAYSYPTHALASQAGYTALVAYQKYEESVPAEARSAVHARATEAALKFARAFPQRPESAGILTRAAQDLYAAGDQARALESAQLLLSRSAGVTTAQQRIGLSIVGQVQFNHGNFPDAETAFTRALALTSAGDPERSSLNERLAAAVYKQADAKRQAGDQLAAADAFLRVARVAPGSSIAETAQYDGATALINAKQWPHAIEVLQTYRRDYPNGKFRADVGHKLAVAYTAAGQSAAAAAEFERIASDPSESPAVVHEALGQAADLYQQSGDLTREVAMREREVRQFPTPVSDAVEQRQRLADIALKQGQIERAYYWQREIVAADASAGAARTERTHYLAARAQLALAVPARDAFRSVKLVAPLKRSLQEKQRALEAAVRAYETVATYQVAETTTAATYETAELYRTLAQDLLASERPKRLSADELEQYQSLLEDQAYPFEEKAISIHELNAQRVRDGVYDDSVRKSMQALAQLMPARYGKTELSERWVAVLKAPAPPPAAPETAAVSSAPTAAGGAPAHLPPPRTTPAAPAARPVVATAVAMPSVPPPSAAMLQEFQHVTDLANGGKDIDASLELQQFELRHPGYATPAVDLALLARRSGHWADSEAAASRATHLDPSDPVAWSELGVTLRAEGKFAQARDAYTHAIAADPNYAPAHRNLGVLLDLYQGDPAGALPEFERYKALTGEDKPVSAWIADVRKRSGAPAPTAAAPGPAPSGPPIATGGPGVANMSTSSGQNAPIAPNSAQAAPNVQPPAARSAPMTPAGGPR